MNEWLKLIIYPNDDHTPRRESAYSNTEEYWANDWKVLRNPKFKWRMLIDSDDVIVATAGRPGKADECLLVYLKEKE